MKNRGEKVFHIGAAQSGQTLAALLRASLPQLSWRKAEQLLESRRVMVNGNLCLDAGRRLKTDEVVKVLAHSAAKLPDVNDIVVRYLDEHLIVVEKPSGMTSLRHSEERRWPARRKQLQPTLDELLPQAVAKRTRSSSSQPGRTAKSQKKHIRGKSRKVVNASPSAGKGTATSLRPVHRLDRETSGLMVFARSPAAEKGLNEQFRRHSIHRCYWSVVLGKISAQTISQRLIRDRGDGRRGTTKDPAQGQHAVTHVRPLKYFGGFSLVECRLETGRTHQIRLHLAAQGHPVCGEKMYNRPFRGRPIVDTSGAPRLALHAAELGFVHPVTGKEIHFKMDFPDDLKEFVSRLQKK